MDFKETKITSCLKTNANSLVWLIHAKSVLRSVLRESLYNALPPVRQFAPRDITVIWELTKLHLSAAKLLEETRVGNLWIAESEDLSYLVGTGTNSHSAACLSATVDKREPKTTF